jgi:hypothetical protein
VTAAESERVSREAQLFQKLFVENFTEAEAFALTPVAQRIDQQGECRRGVAATRESEL